MNAQAAAIRARRIGGNRDDPGIQAAQETGDKFQALRVKQQGPVAGLCVLAQVGRDIACPGIEFGVGEPPGLVNTVVEKGVGELGRLDPRS